MWYDEFYRETLAQEQSATSYQLFGNLGYQVTQSAVTEQPIAHAYAPVVTEDRSPAFQVSNSPVHQDSLFNPGTWGVPQSQNVFENFQELQVGHYNMNNMTSPLGYYSPTDSDGLSACWSPGVESSNTLKRPFESKNSLLAELRNLQLENMQIDDKIKEQNRTNWVLEKRIAETQEKNKRIRQDSAWLQGAYEIVQEREKIAQRMRKEKETLKRKVHAKETEILNITIDAKLLNNLREEKEDLEWRIYDFSEDLIDMDIDFDILKETYDNDLGKMVIFPFWRLEKELKKTKRAKQLTDEDENRKDDTDEDEEEKASTMSDKSSVLSHDSSVSDSLDSYDENDFDADSQRSSSLSSEESCVKVEPMFEFTHDFTSAVHSGSEKKKSKGKGLSRFFRRLHGFFCLHGKNRKKNSSSYELSTYL